MSGTEPAVQFNNVTFSYGGPAVLRDVSLTIQQDDFVAVVGPNGSGKTTLIKLMLAQLKPFTGTVQIFGKSAIAARKKIGYVPQRSDFDYDFPITVMDVVLMGRLGLTGNFGPYRQKDRIAAEKALEYVEIADLKQRPISTLSGGQCQRALLARALAGEPKLLLLDEPTAHLDKRIEQEIYHVLKRLNEHVAIVMVSHDIGFVSNCVSQVACIDSAKVLIHSTADLTGQTKELVEYIYGGKVKIIKHEHGWKKEPDS